MNGAAAGVNGKALNWLCSMQDAECLDAMRDASGLQFAVGTYSDGQPLIDGIRFGLGASVFVGRRFILRFVFFFIFRVWV